MNKRRIIFCIVIIFLLQNFAKAQVWSKELGGYLMQYKVEEGDTLYLSSIKPAFVFWLGKTRSNQRAWRQFYRTVYNFNKAYPYALSAKEKLLELDSVLYAGKLEGSERDNFVKAFEKELFRSFEAPLKNLTISQGQLLLKLIDRELGQTPFYIIKNYRGWFIAGFWQTIAKVFGSDLKKPYDQYGEDKLIEELIGLYNSGAFEFLFINIFGKQPDLIYRRRAPRTDFPK